MREKMLLISAIAPWPANSGGAARMFYTIKYLAKRYQLHVLLFGDEISDAKKRAWLDARCASWQIFPLRSRRMLSSLPYQFSCWQNNALEQAMVAIIKHAQITQVRVEFTQLASLRRLVPAGVKTTFVAHEISTVSYARRARGDWRHADLVTLLQAGFAHASRIEIEAYEKFWLPRYDEVVAVSATDAMWLRQNWHLKQVRVEPNGIEQVVFLSQPKRKILTCGYIGSPQHKPNARAIEFAVQKVLPLLKEPYMFLLAGSHHQKNDDHHVKILGEVAKVRDFYGQIDFLLAPLFAGSGTRMKILESLSFGVPVITTSVGAEGLEITSPFLQIVDAPNEEVLAQALAQRVQKMVTTRARWDTTQNRKQLCAQLQTYMWVNSFAHS